MSTSKLNRTSSEVRKTKEYYNKNAEFWTSRKTHSFHHEIPFRKFAKLLPKGSSVIDIGCAYGIHIPLFLGIGRHLKYTGMDISTSFLKIAKHRYPQITFLEGNIANKSTLPRKRYNGFFAAAVLMHVPEKEWTVMYQNITSLTKSKAIGYISLPTGHPNRIYVSSDVRHFTILDARSQERYLKTLGWKILHKGTLDGSSKEDVWKWYIVQLP